jgi:hypothetical protein
VPTGQQQDDEHAQDQEGASEQHPVRWREL